MLRDSFKRPKQNQQLLAHFSPFGMQRIFQTPVSQRISGTIRFWFGKFWCQNFFFRLPVSAHDNFQRLLDTLSRDRTIPTLTSGRRKVVVVAVAVAVVVVVIVVEPFSPAVIRGFRHKNVRVITSDFLFYTPVNNPESRPVFLLDKEHISRLRIPLFQIRYYKVQRTMLIFKLYALLLLLLLLLLLYNHLTVKI